jgi:hypothetical protein
LTTCAPKLTISSEIPEGVYCPPGKDNRKRRMDAEIGLIFNERRYPQKTFMSESYRGLRSRSLPQFEDLITE